MKVRNPDYEEIGVAPLDIDIRDRIGISIDPGDIGDTIVTSVERLLNDDSFSPVSMVEYRKWYLYNVGNSAKVGADYLIMSLMDKC